MNNLLKAITDRLSVSLLFVGFNVALFTVGTGILLVLRVINDPYTPLPLNFLNITLIGFAWIVVTLFFILVVLCFKYLKRLENIGALLLAFGFLELIVFAFITNDVFQHPFRSKREEESAKLSEMVVKINKAPDSMRKAAFELKKAAYKARMLSFDYRSTGQNASYYRETMVKGLTEEACGYFKQYSEFTALTSVTYVFVTNGNRDVITFRPKNCATTADGTEVLVPTIPSQQQPVAAVSAKLEENKTEAIAVLPPPVKHTEQAVIVQTHKKYTQDIQYLIADVNKVQASLDVLNQQLDELIKAIETKPHIAHSTDAKNLSGGINVVEQPSLNLPAPVNANSIEEKPNALTSE